MSSEVLGILSATLLAKQPVHMSYETLYATLTQNCGKVDQVLADEAKSTYAFAYLDYKVQYQDAAVPAQTLISHHQMTSLPEDYEAALQQSWGWREARAAVSHCQYSTLVMDVMAGGLLPTRRVAWFSQVLLSLLSLATYEAIYCQSSQQFVPPGEFLHHHHSPTPNPLYGFLNVRMFNIANGAPTEVVMDTLGLATLGLPDLQCHFVQLNPSAVATLLYNTGAYLFQQGDVIQDGQTVPGVEPNTRWICQHEMALLAPQREVLDLNPGAPFAAGSRSTSAGT